MRALTRLERLGFTIGHWLDAVGAPLLLLLAATLFASGLPYIIERIGS